MSNPIVKAVVAVIVILLLVPVIQAVWPKPATFERAVAGFETAGLTVSDYQQGAGGGLDAVERATMTIRDASVEIYRYDDEGAIVKNLEYQKDDPGQAIMESWGLAEAMGAAPDKSWSQRTARKGMLMLIARGEDKDLLNRIREAFLGM